jgi:hypothetical protein
MHITDPVARPMRWLAAICLVLTCASCGRDCAGVGVIRVLPTETTIRVGERFTAVYEEGGACDAYNPDDCKCHQVARHWSTADTLVIRLDTLSGEVTGRGVGNANVTTTSPAGPISVLVHVR